MARKSITNKAALIAVTSAFVIGMFATLAVRPINPPAVNSAEPDNAAQVRLNWRVPIVFPRTMPVLGENPVYVAKMIDQASNGGIKFNLFDPGEIAPAFAITDAVRDGKVPAGYTWLGYDQGKIPSSPLISAVPFGMEPWEYSAWWYEAGGRELTENLYVEHNLMPLYCGMTGPETAGWFRQKIETLEDVKGLGASVTMIPGGEIFQALEKGAIDATEFALPIVDQSLGFNRVAKFNYYPGWHQPFTASHLVVNLKVWEQLSQADQALIELACTAAVTRNLAQAEALQGDVIAGFADIGVSAEILPEELLRELNRVADDILNEEAAKDEDFAEILASQRAFRKSYAQWKSRAYLPRDF
jgi:TRAP-type mannitol/chloroaromatic compound transport system substrate-binding protein